MHTGVERYMALKRLSVHLAASGLKGSWITGVRWMWADCTCNPALARVVKDIRGKLLRSYEIATASQRL